MPILSTILFICTLLLNATNKLLICSLIFTISGLVVNSIAELYGRNKAINALVLCVLANMILLWQSLNFMLLISFGSFFVSLYLGIILLDKLKPVFQFQVRNFFSLMLCSLVDSSLVAVSLLQKFHLSRAFTIGLKDFVFKASYTSVATLCLLVVLSLLQQCYSKMKNSIEH